jgi:hypothetical protein
MGIVRMIHDAIQFQDETRMVECKPLPPDKGCEPTVSIRNCFAAVGDSEQDAMLDTPDPLPPRLTYREICALKDWFEAQPITSFLRKTS